MYFSILFVESLSQETIMIKFWEVTSQNSKLQFSRKAPSTCMYHCLKLFSLAAYIAFSLLQRTFWKEKKKTSPCIVETVKVSSMHGKKGSVKWYLLNIKQNGIWVISTTPMPATASTWGQSILKLLSCKEFLKRMNTF